MGESALLPEMVTAGVEAFLECERQSFDEAQTVIAVWLAMEAVKQMYEMKQPETVH